MIELKLDLAAQEAILIGAARAMTSSSSSVNFNAMRREGDDVVLYWNEARNGVKKRRVPLLARINGWMPWGVA